MTLGRTSANKIKIKTDGGLRAVECNCCQCTFQGYLQNQDGTYNQYKYLKVTITGSQTGIQSGCNFPILTGSSANCFYVVERTADCSALICIKAEGTASNTFTDSVQNTADDYQISNCKSIQTRTFVWDGYSEVYPEETFSPTVGSPSSVGNVVNPTYLFEREKVVTITSDTSAQVYQDYNFFAGYWSYCESLSCSDAGTESEECGLCCALESAGSYTYTFELSNDPFN
jgi:hypothetical protein